MAAESQDQGVAIGCQCKDYTIRDSLRQCLGFPSRLRGKPFLPQSRKAAKESKRRSVCLDLEELQLPDLKEHAFAGYVNLRIGG
jgi:hypothetical protein